MRPLNRQLEVGVIVKCPPSCLEQTQGQGSLVGLWLRYCSWWCNNRVDPYSGLRVKFVIAYGCGGARVDGGSSGYRFSTTIATPYMSLLKPIESPCGFRRNVVELAQLTIRNELPSSSLLLLLLLRERIQFSIEVIVVVVVKASQISLSKIARLNPNFEWSLVTTMDYIPTTKISSTSKLSPPRQLLNVNALRRRKHQKEAPRERVRWTLHRKLRKCKRIMYDNHYNTSYSKRRKRIKSIESWNVNFMESCLNKRCKDLLALDELGDSESDGVQDSIPIFREITHTPNLRTSGDTKIRPSMEPIKTNRSTTGGRIIQDNSHYGKRNLSGSRKCAGLSALGGRSWTPLLLMCIICLISDFNGNPATNALFPHLKAEAALIIGDSAIEIQELDPEISNNNNQNIIINNNEASQSQPNELIFGSTGSLMGSLESQLTHGMESIQPTRDQSKRPMSSNMPGPLPPISSGSSEDITDGDKRSRNGHDYDITEPNLNERQAEKSNLNDVFSAKPTDQSSLEDKTIAGKVVDFELTPAGGHNKAKIKKKKMKKQKKEEEMFKKWGKKKKSEKKAEEKRHKESMKKKKEEEKKGKKKWGKEEHGMKKKGNFKKKKWGKKVKKGKGVKKGKKGKKFLKDVGHKNTGFKTVYHKEEWGKSSKWHDIKRQKKWDEKSKKWKKKWKKEKGKKYKGDHMKKFEKKKKAGKKYKKESKDKYKKYKKEKFEKGKKKKMEEKSKKKEGGAKKMMKEMKKKKKKH